MPSRNARGVERGVIVAARRPENAARDAEPAKIAPAMTLAAIHGPGHVFSPRAHPGTTAWLTDNDVLLDRATGGQHPILGDMPSLCSVAVATDEILALLAE